MQGSRYIKEKQKAWANKKGITLLGSKIYKGEELYTKDLNDNLYMPLSDRHKEEFRLGNGSEMVSDCDSMSKMNALHSSSATSVNFFHYWSSNNKLSDIAYACSLCNKGNNVSEKLYFEKKCNIVDKSFFGPNIDVVIENNVNHSKKVFAIECKFTEPYSNDRGNQDKELFPSEYLKNEEIWKDLPHLFDLASKIGNGNKSYSFLNAGQLIKHILGLTKAYGKSRFRLLYLYYDVLGEESYKHLQELREFREISKRDRLTFSYNTYQEVIVKLNKHYYDDNKNYLNYINERYF